MATYEVHMSVVYTTRDCMMVLLFICYYILKIQILKRQLSRQFEMKDLGAIKKILGMEIRKDKKVGKLYLS